MWLIASWTSTRKEPTFALREQLPTLDICLTWCSKVSSAKRAVIPPSTRLTTASTATQHLTVSLATPVVTFPAIKITLAPTAAVSPTKTFLKDLAAISAGKATLAWIPTGHKIIQTAASEWILEVTGHKIKTLLDRIPAVTGHNKIQTVSTREVLVQVQITLDRILDSVQAERFLPTIQIEGHTIAETLSRLQWLW